MRLGRRALAATVVIVTVAGARLAGQAPSPARGFAPATATQGLAPALSAAPATATQGPAPASSAAPAAATQGLAPARGSAPAAAAQGAPPGARAQGAPPPDVPAPQGYTYDPAGRRDPFVSLVGRSGNERPAMGVRPPGLPGLAVDELTLKGTLQSRGGYVAIVQGSDNKTYIAHAGDRLFDGTVRTITSNAMVLMQQVNDPLSPTKQREVRKTIRQIEEAK